MATVNPLQTALTGLRVAQAQIGVTSNNIANVSTDGYTKKTLQQYSTVVDGQGTGVQIGQVERKIDQILLRDYRAQISTTSGLATRQNFLDQVQGLHGAPDQEVSISATIGKLKDSFAQLGNQPEGSYQLRDVYNKATALAQQFNDFSNSMTEMRNNAQTAMSQSVDHINALTAQIAQLNTNISQANAVGRTAPDLEDQRDVAVRELAKEVDLSYYTDGSNTLVVMTKNGQLLADNNQNKMYFNPAPLGPGSYYPVGAAAIRIGNPTTGSDLTSDAQLGGNLGALVDMRDNVLPTYQAQIDELAQKTAMRFDAEGLRLFTSGDGTVPANTASGYTGFAATIQINPAIIADQTLIRTGTTAGAIVQDGSDEVLRKVLQFSFGTTQYEQQLGDQDISSTTDTLFTTLGLSAQSKVIGQANASALGSLDSSPYIIPGTNDTFTLQVGAGAPSTITITAGQTASDLVTSINTAFPGMASLGPGGQLLFTANNSLTIGAGTLGPNGLSELGLTAGTTAAVNPSFQINIGNDAPTTIEILPTDKGADLLTKLNAIPGVSASFAPTTNYLLIKPTLGGDITTLDGQASPLAALGMTETNVLHPSFNSTNLGPAGSIDGRIQNGTTLLDYATQLVSIQSQDAENVDTSMKTEDNYRATLENEYMDSTGVNLDEEMANLISIQNAYTASARAISAVQAMLDELMNTFR